MYLEYAPIKQSVKRISIVYTIYTGIHTYSFMGTQIYEYEYP